MQLCTYGILSGLDQSSVIFKFLDQRCSAFPKLIPPHLTDPQVPSRAADAAWGDEAPWHCSPFGSPPQHTPMLPRELKCLWAVTRVVGFNCPPWRNRGSAVTPPSRPAPLPPVSCHRWEESQQCSASARSGAEGLRGPPGPGRGLRGRAHGPEQQRPLGFSALIWRMELLVAPGGGSRGAGPLGRPSPGSAAVTIACARPFAGTSRSATSGTWCPQC